MTFRNVRWTLACAAALLLTRHVASQNVCDGVSRVNNTNLTRVTVASGLTSGTSGPLFVSAPPGDTNRIMIVLQNGTIRQLIRGAAPTASTVFLDIDPRVTNTFDEQGLLGLAFSPTFATDGIFYVSYTRTSDGDLIVSRFRTLDGTGNTAGDPASEQILFRVDDNESNHNGGWMSFGPDGFLYISQGDGGNGGDPHGACGNGQNTGVILGKMLRIDPTGSVGTAPDCALDPGSYTIPPGNPLADGPGGDCDEIWAYGLRNPWRDSFDTLTGDLYIADVGQGCWEEINWAPSTSTGGENYGWRNFEGRHCFNAPSMSCTPTSSPADGCQPACSDPVPVGDAEPNGTRVPILEYPSNGGAECSVTGGYVYRGCRMTGFQGKYFYGDYCAGTVLSFQQVGGVATNPQSWTAQVGTSLALDLTSFGQDAQGELYITDRDGLVYMLLPPLTNFEVSGAGAIPFQLSKTGPWTWEDLAYTSRHTITAYRVHRANVADGVFNVGEVFDCVFTSPTPSWPGGDAADPLPGAFFAYVVTGLNGPTPTSPGGTPTRTLSGVVCP